MDNSIVSDSGISSLGSEMSDIESDNSDKDDESEKEVEHEKEVDDSEKESDENSEDDKSTISSLPETIKDSEEEDESSDSDEESEPSDSDEESESSESSESIEESESDDEMDDLEREYNENQCSNIKNKYSKKCNNILKAKELLENDILRDNNDSTYPSYDDPNFNAKIASKSEFASHKYDAKLEDIQIRDIKEYSDYLSKMPFALAPHQYFVKNFLSPNTPYNSLLLFHGLGTGKTCSAIGIAEEERNFMKSIGIHKKIIIIATPNVQENFKRQLFDEKDLKNENGIWRSSSCLGNKFIIEVNPTNIPIPRDQMVSQIKTIISQNYSFMGYGQFSSYIELIATRGTTDPIKMVHNLQKEFDGKMLIFDEIHNVSEDDKEDKSISINLMRLVKSATVKLLLLTATPMFNSHKSIIWLINLMNINDKRSHIYVNEVFDKDGNFIEGDGDVGKNLLIRKSRGYISFVRSDNPYIFPFRIYPYIFAPEKSFPTLMHEGEAGYEYPKYQLNGMTIEDGIKMLSIYLNNIHPYQYNGYKYIIDSFLNRSLTKKNKFDKVVRVGDIRNMKTFNYPILQLPLESLNIIYPHEVLDDFDSTSELSSMSSNMDSELSMGGSKGFDSFDTFFHSLQKSIDDGKNIIKVESVKKGGAQPEQIDVHLLTGSEGLRRVMDFEDTDTVKGNFSYKPKYENMFSPENIGKYSCKIKNICDCIYNGTPSEGIIMIYSQYIDAGIIPMALALEEMGFERYKNKSLLQNKPRKRLKMKYIMITGDKRISPNNSLEYRAVSDKDNKNGDKIKVVLISSAGSEGLDFKCIRQVHIMEPWYNINKMEQVFGRGVRNFSHKDLPFEKRNTQLFLHGTIFETEEEAVDLYIYRIAEKKSIKIGEVARVLKQNAVDCIINHEQLNFNYKNFQDKSVKQQLSVGGEIDFIVGDVPYSAICDYQKDCDYECFKTDVQIKETVDETFLEKMSENITMNILRLFKEGFFYKKKDFKIKCSKEELNYALSKLIDEETIVYDKYNRAGKIVNVGEYYLFQPIELENKNITVFERTLPIDVKMKSIIFKVDNDTRKANIDEQNEKEIKELDEPSGFQPEILKEMFENFTVAKEMYESDLSTFKNDNWFKNCGVAMQYLSTKIDIDRLYYYLIEHMVDSLFFREKVILLTYLFISTEDNYFENKLREIFDKQIKKGDITYIILYDTEEKILVKDDRWRDATPEEKRMIKSYPNPEYNFGDYVGYIDYDVKNNIYVFKTKNMQERTHKGARCDEKGKMKTIEILNYLVGSEEFTKENTKAIKKTSTVKGRPQFVQSILCILLEFYMRHLNDIQKDGKVWFCSMETMQIKN